MVRNFFAIALAIIVLLFLAQAPGLHAQPYRVVANQTIPTRTPTPLPVTPTIEPPNNPTPGNPPPEATLPPTGATATPIPVSPTPIVVYLPTAVPCSNQPTIQAINHVTPTNIRLGPGTDYATVGQLVVNEVRPIIGRAADAPWWLIQLNDGQNGWVADEVVLVEGNTAHIAVVAAPPLNGVAPTPGSPWQPTPLPECPSTATPTAVSQATHQTVVVSPLETSTQDVSYPADTPTETGETAVQDAAVTPTATAITLPTSIAAAPQPTLPATAVPPDNTARANRPDFSALLLVGAALLLVAGTAVFIVKRRP